MKTYLYYRSVLIAVIATISINLSAQVLDDFSLENIDYEVVSLEEAKGSKLTVIDFWATWCKPCTKAMPKLNDIYMKYKDQGLGMIGISCDGPRSISRVSTVSKNLNIDYHILKDIDCEVMNTLQFQSFPTLILINESSEIVHIHQGYNSGDEKDIEETIIKYLN
jgi:Peroxiredoxin